MEPTPTAGPSPATRVRTPAYTWDDFLGLEDDDRRELIDGELIEVEVPTFLHEHIVLTLGYFLKAWTRLRGGVVVGSGYKVRISNTRGVMPDIQYYGPQNPRSKSAQDTYDTKPDLAVEIISPSSEGYDRKTKLHWYAEIGVPEYWIVDSEAQSVERYVLNGENYGVPETLTGSAIFRPATFPGLEIPLAELWTY